MLRPPRWDMFVNPVKASIGMFEILVDVCGDPLIWWPLVHKLPKKFFFAY